MHEVTLVGYDTEPIASPTGKVREKEDEFAAETQSAKGRAGEQIVRLAPQKAAAKEGSQALLERRLAEASRESEREMHRLQEALDRCKAARERRTW